MSRSYKKNTYCNDGATPRTRIAKRFANKAVRRAEDIECNKHGNYKKVYDTWNIHDYRYKVTWEEAKKDYEEKDYLQKRYPTLKSYYRHWYKCFKSK